MASPFRPTGRLIAASVAVLGLVLWLGGAQVWASFTAASVQNAGDTAAVAGMALTHTYNSTTCVSTGRVSSVACAGTLGTVASPPASRADSITNNGSVAVTQSVTGASCAVVQFANSVSSTDPLLPRNSVAFQQGDKWGTTTAATFSGSGYATDPIGTSGSGLLGLLTSNYTIGVWFNPADAQGGGLLSLGASLSNSSSATANPAIWLDTTGHVHFAFTSTLGTVTAASTHTFTSGWHFAVLAVSSTIVVSSAVLYVDGASEATGGGLSLLTNASGYWHLGWADFTGLAAPTSRYFHGSLSGAFVDRQTAYSGASVSSLYSSASASAYQTSLAGQPTISSLWPLGDTGYGTVSGSSLPGNINDPCSKVMVTWTFTSPAASIGSQTLTAFANNVARSVAAPAVGGTQSLSIATAQGAGYNTDQAGLHLYVPLTFTYGVSGAANWIQTFIWSADPTDVFWG